ncbi:unnamed protein product [Rhizophagus irregularis]|nr:unnamed protein product [Rhizophagus irregularis]
MSSSDDDIRDDIRVVVGIDFGTTYSGFAFAHKSNPNEIIVQDYWRRHEGWFKTPTVIKYDDSYTNVISWGLSALATRPRGRSWRPSSKPIELFKLHLLENGLSETATLPDALNYKDVIKDYLRELGKDIKRRVRGHWCRIDFDSQVIIVITVPAEFDDNAIAIMSECAVAANLIERENNERNLKFITEPEAAAIASVNSLRREYHLNSGDLFMVVDCGGDRIRREFPELPNISVPTNPIASVMKGAVKFGLSEKIVESRVLNWTYGTCVVRKWLPTDPLSYKLPNGYVKVFETFGEKGYGDSVKLNYKVIKNFKSFSLTQRKMNIDMYVTKSLDAKYIGDPEIKLLRKFQLELPELDSYEDIEDITISFTLKFGYTKMFAAAINKNTGHECKVTFKYEFD